MTESILALDQGTTSSRAILFNRGGHPLRAANVEYPQQYPRPGWVEHDPNDILASQIAAAREVLDSDDAASVAAIGIANQRETTLLWDRRDGRPVSSGRIAGRRVSATTCARRAGKTRSVRVPAW